MDLIEFLKDKKCPAPKSLLAEKLFSKHSKPGITFHNKLHNIQGRKFTDEEKRMIISILHELGKQYSTLTID